MECLRLLVRAGLLWASALRVLAASFDADQFSELVATNLPVAWWKFDEGTGSDATDSAGNGHTGSISGAVWTTGKDGGALSFNGVNSYVFASDAQSGGTNGVGARPSRRNLFSLNKVD
jgi:hypothetical protein